MTSARNCALGSRPYSSYPGRRARASFGASSSSSEETDEAVTHRARKDPVLGWRDISSARSRSRRRRCRRRIARDGLPDGTRTRLVVSADAPRTVQRRASLVETDEVDAIPSPRVPSIEAVIEPALRCGANSDGLLMARTRLSPSSPSSPPETPPRPLSVLCYLFSPGRKYSCVSEFSRPGLTSAGAEAPRPHGRNRFQVHAGGDRVTPRRYSLQRLLRRRRSPQLIRLRGDAGGLGGYVQRSVQEEDRRVR